MATIETLKTSVLIAGGGPTGLSLAVELGIRGVDVILLERNTSRGVQPRAKTLNVRSAEHLRRWGVADAIRRANPLPADYKNDIVFMTRLFGHHIATIPDVFFGRDGTDERFSEAGQWIPQYTVERILWDKVDELPSVKVLQGVGLADFSQTGDHVSAITGGDMPIHIEADYLVGADGARSRVRELIGAKMEGRHAYGANFNLVLRIPDLEQEPPARQAIMYWTINAESAALIGPMDSGARWYFCAPMLQGVTTLTRPEIEERVQAAVGRPIAFEILSEDPWFTNALIADIYRKGRVFLAGDACHLTPPFGGYGMNMCIADGADLGWKLAARLQGWGGEALLDSYEKERRPVHKWTIDAAIENYSTMGAGFVREGLEEDSVAGEKLRAQAAEEILAAKTQEFRTLGVVLGYNYGGSPVIISDGEDLSDPIPESYVPQSKPGCLAPHFWLGKNDSIYDHFGSGFTLLIPDGDEASGRSFSDAAAELNLPLKTVVGNARMLELYGPDLAIVRPDQHIAWRGQVTGLGEAKDILARVAGRSEALVDQLYSAA